MGGRFLQSIFAYLQLACHSWKGWEQWAAGCRGWRKSSAALNASPRRLHWVRWTQAALTAWLQGDQCFCYPLWCWRWFFFFNVSHLYLFQRMSPGGLHTSKHAELPNECEMCVFPKMCKTLRPWVLESENFEWDSDSTYFWQYVLGHVPWPQWDLLFSSAEWGYYVYLIRLLMGPKAVDLAQGPPHSNANSRSFGVLFTSNLIIFKLYRLLFYVSGHFQILSLSLELGYKGVCPRYLWFFGMPHLKVYLSMWVL